MAAVVQIDEIHKIYESGEIPVHAVRGVTLTIEDDGVGFDPSTIAGSMEGGFGMKSMRERVEQIGGSIDVHTAPNEGTTIVVRLDAEDTRGTPSAEAPGAARR